MRPDYDGVKFYGKEDMGNAIQLKKADSIIFAFNKNSEYTDINAVIELYNIQQLYDVGITLKTWTKKECFNRKQIVNSMTSAIGRLFSKINENNWLDYVNKVASIYVDDFWALFARFEVYKRVNSESFVMYLKKSRISIMRYIKAKENCKCL